MALCIVPKGHWARSAIEPRDLLHGLGTPSNRVIYCAVAKPCNLFPGSAEISRVSASPFSRRQDGRAKRLIDGFFKARLSLDSFALPAA